MLFSKSLPAARAGVIPLRLLAHLGDAVFSLYEREREVMSAVSARQMHEKVVSRVRASKQAELLDALAKGLTEAETDIVRRARNLKAVGYGRRGQNQYRKATAFEALVGFLYLTDRDRLEQLLESTLGLEGSPPEKA